MKIDILKPWAPVFGILFLFAGCEYEGPEPVWDPNADLGPIPKVTAVDPADSAGIGVTQIRIVGENLGDTIDKTSVYFNQVKAINASVSPGEVVVYRPAMVGEGILIKVIVQGAYVVAKWDRPYKILPVFRSFGYISDRLKGSISMVDVAKDGSVYITISKRIYKVLADESAFYPVGDQDYRGTTSDLRIGPGGYLYMKKKDHEMVYRLNVALEDPATITEEYGAFPKKASFIDFDDQGNCYGGGNKTGISVLTREKTSFTTGNFQDLDIQGLRVFQGFVYVFDATGNIWRAPILDAEGHLGDKEQVLEWATTGDYARYTLSAFDFSEDGVIYCGTDHPNPFLMVYPNGSTEPLYRGILNPKVEDMAWSNGEDFYYVCKSATSGIPDLYLVRAGKKGAPYHGRLLD